MRYFPLFLDLEGRKAVIVGGGDEALSKARLLAKTGAQIAIVAAEIQADLAEVVPSGRAVWLATTSRRELHDDAAIVYAADRTLAGEVSAAAQQRGIPVNAVDAADISTFITPSVVDRDPVVIA